VIVALSYSPYLQDRSLQTRLVPFPRNSELLTDEFGPARRSRSIRDSPYETSQRNKWRALDLNPAGSHESSPHAKVSVIENIQRGNSMFDEKPLIAARI
jgi:hypothetical protein